MNKISFVIPCYRSENTLAGVVGELKDKMATMSDEYSYEIILVNDDSPDGTYKVIEDLAAGADNIFGLSLARNFGQHAALMAGFHYVTGDMIVCLDDDGQKIMSRTTAPATGANVAYVHTKQLQMQQKQEQYLKEHGVLPDPDEELLSAEESSMPFD